MAEKLQTVQLPANQLTVPAAGEQLFGMRHSDWKRIRGRVLGLGRPLAGLAHAAWAVIGIGASAFLGWIAWLGTEAQMTPELRLQFTAISPILITTCVASAAIATAFLVVDRKLVAHTSLTVQQVLDEMDELYEPYATAGSADLGDQLREKTVPSTPLSDTLPWTVHTSSAWTRRSTEVQDGKPDVGARVSHEDFGEGEVIELSGQGPKTIATIAFDNFGTKRILLKVAPIRILPPQD